MKIKLQHSSALLAGATLLLSASIADARSYGVSSSSAGRGTKYTSSRGGSAYVGPHGAAAQGANGRTAAATKNGAAYAGPHGAAVGGRYGSAAVTNNKGAYATSGGAYAAVATRPVATTLPVSGVAAATRPVATTLPAGGAAVATPPVATTLPAGYISTVPAGYTTTVMHGGYSCSYVGGIYYRPVFYEGTTVYVVVN
jgi:hypothetical protein